MNLKMTIVRLKMLDILHRMDNNLSKVAEIKVEASQMINSKETTDAVKAQIDELQSKVLELEYKLNAKSERYNCRIL